MLLGLDKEIKDNNEETFSTLQKEVEKFIEEVKERERENTKRFAKLPKGILFQFGEYQIYKAH